MFVLRIIAYIVASISKLKVGAANENRLAIAGVALNFSCFADRISDCEGRCLVNKSAVLSSDPTTGIFGAHLANCFVTMSLMCWLTPTRVKSGFSRIRDIGTVEHWQCSRNSSPVCLRSVQPASDQRPTPLVLVTVFDPPMTVPADLREEAADRCDKLKRDIIIHGNVAQDRTEEDPVFVRVTDCRVSADRSFKWYVYAAISLSLTMSSSLIIATAHRRYILGAPSTLYADTFHLSWVLYQITALLCKEVLEDSDVSLDVFIRRLRKKTESKADLCWKIVTRVENAI